MIAPPELWEEDDMLCTICGSNTAGEGFSQCLACRTLRNIDMKRGIPTAKEISNAQVMFDPPLSAETETKPPNPKQAYGDKKPPLHLVPPVAITYMAVALKEGARKYGAYNWRTDDVEAMTYVGAAMRHLGAYLDGENLDPESGNPHLAHALASIAILVDAQESGKLIDNRPPAGPMPAVQKGFISAD